MSLAIQHRHATLPVAYVVGGTTDSTNETVFHSTGGTTNSGGYLLVEANTPRVGDLFQCFAVVDCPSTNSTDTLTLKAYLGPETGPTTGILVCDQTAIDMANDGEIALQFWVAVEAVGAGSTARFSSGGFSFADGATAISKTVARSQTDAQLSTATQNVFALTATWSASSADNLARLRSFHYLKFPALPSQ